MNKKALKVLEYHKILSIVSELAVCEESKTAVLDIKPSCDYDEVCQMQEATAQASSMIIMHGGLPVSPVKNVSAAIKRAEMGGSLSLGELLSVASILRVARRINSYMKSTDKFDILSGMSQGLVPLRDLEQRISDAIISEDSVADNASPQLAALRRKVNQLNDKIKDTLSSMLHSCAKYLQDPIITMRKDRYVLPVKVEHKANVPGILHDSSATGATVFIEPMAVVQMNNMLRDVMIAQEREIEKIVAEFSAEIALSGDEIKINYNIIKDLDILFAKAQFSNNLGCVQPRLNRDGVMEIKKAKHPLIDKNKVVPITVYLGKNFDTLVITGPNTGGKTVSLKTIGLFALMCQSGLHLPAEGGTNMPVYSDVFADIGDEQSIEQSLSTFSSHMVNIVDILNTVGPGTLALFDELGAGTDPEEGAALAIEILEYMRACGAKAVATTHYSELKMYALSTDRVENASCEFDVETLRPTYRLLIGVPGKSNAFAISKRLGLYDTILEKASARMTAESVQFEDVIKELQTKRDEASIAQEQALQIKSEAEKLLIEAKKERDSMKLKRSKMVEEAQREARNILQRAKDETNEVLKNVRKLSEQAATQAQVKELEKLRNDLNEKNSELAEKQRKKQRKSTTKASQIKLGMTVEILSMDDRGTVVSMPNNNGDFEVQIGIIRVKTNIKDVIPVKDETHKKIGKTVMTSRAGVSSKSISVKNELDLRGMMAYDAMMEVEKFIDDAVLASLPRVSIIHGKGTGALRSAVHNELRANKFVKKYRLGSFGEGDTGVTIVELV